MRQDETTLVKQAYAEAKEQLEHTGRVPLSFYMLVTRNPQTGAKLSYPTAIGTRPAEPFASRAEHDEFLEHLRAEALRLDAQALVLCGEAEAEIEDDSGVRVRRVVVIRIEDRHGIEHLHAAIESHGELGLHLGPLLAGSDPAADGIAPLLPVHGGGQLP